MIYSRFGTKLTPVSKEQDANGRVSIQVTTEETSGLRNYAVADLTADEGMTEINETVSKLPWKVVEASVPRRPRHIR